jgi:hypothetical protein
VELFGHVKFTVTAAQALPLSSDQVSKATRPGREVGARIGQVSTVMTVRADTSLVSSG